MIGPFHQRLRLRFRLYNAGPGLCISRRLVLGFARERIHKLLTLTGHPHLDFGLESTTNCFVLIASEGFRWEDLQIVSSVCA